MKSREESRGKNLAGWSLTRSKPEPSIDKYIVNIDGSSKQQTSQRANGTSGSLNNNSKV